MTVLHLFIWQPKRSLENLHILLIQGTFLAAKKKNYGRGGQIKLNCKYVICGWSYRKNSTLFASHLSSYGGKRFQNQYPDIYDLERQEITHFLGCYHHGHQKQGLNKKIDTLLLKGQGLSCTFSF